MSRRHTPKGKTMKLKMRTLEPVTLILFALGIDLYQPGQSNGMLPVSRSDITSFLWFAFSLACNALVS